MLKADRINVFVPLVDITPEIGGTEMKKCSHFHDHGRRGTSFAGYAELASVTHYVPAGAPVIMDYRVWHRGKANSSSLIRPLLYFKYTRNLPRPADPSSAKRQSVVAVEGTVKKKKRVALITQST
jgi:ectoine hydroxylase-related dioxygenase (phytanoyl-CoA dioxygenase family)